MTDTENAAAREQLYDFALATLNEVTQLERHRYPGDPSLNVLARVDVGIMQNEKGKYKYFVNEIERGVALSFFLFNSDIAALPLLEKVGCALRDYLDFQ